MTKFEKVSYEQYVRGVYDIGPQYSMFEAGYGEEWEDIILPKRATKHSAGYDFFAPYSITILPGCAGVIYTGIRVMIPDDMFLAIYPRSSLGIKRQVTLANTVGIIDADYYHADNEGHIVVKLINNGANTVIIKKGQAFAQGIFQKYYTTDDDSASGTRTGGIGSTDNT